MGSSLNGDGDWETHWPNTTKEVAEGTCIQDYRSRNSLGTNVIETRTETLNQTSDLTIVHPVVVSEVFGNLWPPPSGILGGREVSSSSDKSI